MQKSADVDSPQTSKHIALIGFMGAGKSTVGPLVAQLLGCRFVDLDDLIVERAGISVADLFRNQGEVAFRAQERAALRDALGQPSPIVLATGGGAFMDPTARDSLLQQARCVYLRTPLATVLQRLGSEAALVARPLLAGPDATATAGRLYAERQAVYEQCPLAVDTEGHNAAQVADLVVEVLGGPAAKTAANAAAPLLSITSSSGVYPVQLRPAAGAWLAHACIDACQADRLAVITDTHVARLHAEPLLAALRATGRTVTLHCFAAGEDSKTLGTAAALYDELLDAGLGRKAALVALGGGVVGDVTGFVASTYMRGIAYVQVPTTTLAAVDSSVGGKTGVNTSRGKNLVGTFYPPRAVLIAASHLATQTTRAHAAGLVESLKMASTYDAELFSHIVDQAEALLRFEPDAVLDVIRRSIAIKAGVVSRDEREAGERAVLNLGHTLGHAIETGEAYRLLHGECVGLGMLAETAWAVEAGLCSPDVLEAMQTALLALKMPVEWRRAKLDVDAMGLDKKRVGADVVLTIVPTMGNFELRAVPLRGLAEFAQRK